MTEAERQEMVEEERQVILDETDERYPDPLPDPGGFSVPLPKENAQVATRDPNVLSAPAAINPMAFIATAVANNAGIDTLERLMTLQERWEANTNKKAFNAAMADFRGEVPDIGKDASVAYETDRGVTSYNHASLDHICHQINPVLSKFGLSFNWSDPKQEGGLLHVTCRVSHRLGHTEGTTLVSALDTSGGKNAIQSLGSTSSYLSRYTLVMALGLSTGEDDDGRASGGPPGAPTDAPGGDYCPDDQFDALFPTWKEKILVGIKDPAEILAWIASKGLNLSPAQITRIQQIRA